MPRAFSRTSFPMQRREFIKASFVTAAALNVAAPSQSAAAQPGAQPRNKGTRVDTNVTLFHWPCRRLPLDETPALLKKMDEHAIDQAWAGSFESLLHRDIAGVNQRLADECGRSNGRLIPFGAINPTLPGWEDDVRRCHEVHHMPGVRVYPNYHGYTLVDPRFKRLLELTAERSLLVQLALQIEDPRTQHPMMTVADVNPAPLPDLMKAVPRARLLLLNGAKALEGALFDRLTASPQIHYDTARMEGTGMVGRLIRRSPPGRIVFGTHAPFFIYEAAIIKLYEGELTADETRALLEENPRLLLQA
jgi:predicted TIM-barrel fold metal-dependent hydrolase